MKKEYIIIDRIDNKIHKYNTYAEMEWQLKGLVWDYETRGWIIKKDTYNNGSIVALKYIKDMFD